jgi:hypothetical protein
MCGRLYGVPEPDIDLHANLCAAESRLEHDPESAVLHFFPDRFRTQGRDIERHSVVRNEDRADVLDAIENRINRTATVPGEVEVARRPVDGAAPEGEEHGAFEDELITVRGHTEPIEKAFGGVALKNELGILPAFASAVEQAAMDGGGQVAWRSIHRSSASR